MKIEKTAFEGLLKIFPDLHRDKRGTFCEVCPEDAFFGNAIL